MRYLYIAGKWTEAAAGGTSQTINPYDASPLDTLSCLPFPDRPTQRTRSDPSEFQGGDVDE